jgi:hypothetical protein
VRYELGFIFQKKTFFIVTAVKTSTLALKVHENGMLMGVAVGVVMTRLQEAVEYSSFVRNV